jgi:hypothetical protein
MRLDVIKSFVLPAASLFKRYIYRRIRLRLQLLYAGFTVWIPAEYPDFFCIGAPRAATTWLHNRLSGHPDLFLPRIKELHFFDEPPEEEQYATSFRRRQYFDMHSASHRRWYALHYSKAGRRLKGDITPAYSILSKRRVALIADRLPDLKIIYILRDPVERAWSGVCRPLRYKPVKYMRSEKIIADLCREIMHPAVLSRGDYKSVIETWETFFSKDRILYLFYDDILDQPRRQLEKVCSFLGVEHSGLPDAREDKHRFNASPKFKMPDSVRKRLADYYAEQIRFLEKKFKRSFKHLIVVFFVLIGLTLIEAPCLRAASPRPGNYAHPPVFNPVPNGLNLTIPTVLENRELAASGFVDITGEPFKADCSGKTDSTRQIQQAINFARDQQMVCFFPEGRYMISDTLTCLQEPYIKTNKKLVGGRNFPCVLVGSRKGRRPEIILAANSPGFDKPSRPKYVIHFWARRIKHPQTSSDPQPSISMNQMLINLNITIDRGNPGAVAIRHRGAQGSVVQDSVIDVTYGHTGLEGGAGSGGSHAGLSIIGGKIGLNLSESQPAPTIAGIRLINQTGTALLYKGRQSLCAVGLYISTKTRGPVIRGPKKPQRPHLGQICLIDSEIIFNGPPGTAVSSASSLYLKNIYLQGAARVVDNPDGSQLPGNPAGRLCVREYAHGSRPREVKGFQFEAPIYINGQKSRADLVKTVGNQKPPPSLVAAHLWDQKNFPSWESKGAVNVKLPPYNAKGDCKTDDTQALQRAINENEIIFIPKGYYLVSRSLQLKPGTKLIGAARHLSIITAAGNTGDFQNQSAPQPVIQTADTPQGGTILASLGIFVPRAKTGAYALSWRTGLRSVLRGVNFYYRPLRLKRTKLERAYKKNFPLIVIAGHGGGKWYNFFQESRFGQGKQYRHILVKGTRTPLAFYQCNPEHAGSEADMEIRNAANVSIYGLKSEEISPALWIKNSNYVNVFGYGGNAAPLPGGTLFRIDDSADFRIANAVDTFWLSKNRTAPDKWHMIIERFKGNIIKTDPLERPVLYCRE